MRQASCVLPSIQDGKTCTQSLNKDVSIVKKVEQILLFVQPTNANIFVLLVLFFISSI